MPTSKDVAVLAGVSPATVSRVFRGETVVKEKTRKLVSEAARQLNYTPSHAASVLKKNNNRTVAFLDPDPRNPFYIQMISQIGEILQEQYGFSLLMAPDTHYDKRLIPAIQTFLSYRVEAIVFSPIMSRLIPQLSELLTKEQDCKFLQLHSKCYPQVDSIAYNDVLGMDMATSYLLSQGHRRILIVSDDVDRIQGCHQAYRKAGITSPEIPVVPLPVGVTAQEVFQCIKKARPTAIIAVSEMLGLATYNALSRLDLRVPQDVSLIVFDDTAWTQAMGITVIKHDDQEVVQYAVDRLTGLIDGRYTQVDHHIILPYLEYRNSVRKILP